ncbi:hypothetical protein ACMSD4_12050 [Bacteroides thetaiotaomicron]|jgi:hypothetical protein|uniref:hypothetical protein n=1 Tax=Bacteroides thetaiotaomicron TaxID=818 RepID=UPI0020643E85|nr:MAG TPA: hypothetical protein [Caudoviricetes sp.]
MDEFDINEFKKKVIEMQQQLEKDVDLKLLDGTYRTIKVSLAKGIKIINSKNGDTLYSRLYLKKNDKQSGHKYLDVVSPTMDELLKEFGPALTTITMQQQK